MTIRCGLSIEQRPVGVAFPRPKTASGGLRHIPHRRVGRTALQPTGAPWKNRLRYDLARRGAVLLQSANLENRPCSGFEKALQGAGEFVSGIGSDVTKGGLAIGTVGLGLAVGGAVTGNVPMAGVGVLVMGGGANVTGGGGLITAFGAALQTAGGRPTSAVFKILNDQLTSKLPFASLYRGYIKQGLKKVEENIPQVNLCQ